MTVWDDVRRGAQSVVEGGQGLVRAARLKAAIRALEAELGEKIRDLGTRVLDLHRRNELHHYELDEIFVSIQALQRELADKTAEVDALLAPGRAGGKPGAGCPDCGAEARPGDRFCRNCGCALRGE
ncbi:MAG: zinc ribbon domain-containing protein [Armatimonadetes bacterium]|nr:zinc ribbon domain-containing protein [Armatimonadota bacterium]